MPQSDRSDLYCLISLQSPSLWSTLLWSDHSPELCLILFVSNVSNTINSGHYNYAPLCLLCSVIIDWVLSSWIVSVWIWFLRSGLSFTPLVLQKFENKVSLGYISPSSSVYYDIEFVNNLNIELIFIIVNIIQYLSRNAAGILLLYSDPDLHFFS